MDAYELMMNSRNIQFRLNLNSGNPYIALSCVCGGKEMGTIRDIKIVNKEDFNERVLQGFSEMTLDMLERIKSHQNGEDEILMAKSDD